jgi:hypothetical protein
MNLYCPAILLFMVIIIAYKRSYTNDICMLAKGSRYIYVDLLNVCLWHVIAYL